MKSQNNWYKFDDDYWLETVTRPDWYLEFNNFNKQARRDLGIESEQYKKLINDIRKFFNNSLQKGMVALASGGPDLDEPRKPVDTIVIHHTSSRPGYDLNYMNAVQLLNVYVPYFTKPTLYEERKLKGTPIWSGHSKNDRPVFWLYHWLLRMDGKMERLLDDKCIGWHAGNWDINRRSVAICLDNDYQNICPSNDLLKILASKIKKNYPQVKRIIGHCEAYRDTICPGSHFEKEWKPKLLDFLK